MSVIYMGGNIAPHAYIIWTHKETASQSRTVCYDQEDVQMMIDHHNESNSFYNERYMHIFDASNLPTLPDGSVDESEFWQQVEDIRQQVLNQNALDIA